MPINKAKLSKGYLKSPANLQTAYQAGISLIEHNVGISDKIQSIRDMVADPRDFIRPPIEKLEQFKTDLFEKENEHALSYLKIDRGYSDDTIKHFKLGYNKGEDAIAIPNFKNGELINIMYRRISPQGKQSKYIQEKDAEVWMFNEKGIDLGLPRQTVLVVEGQFDCMSVWQAGIKNVVSVGSGKESYGMWMELLDPIAEIYIAYDNDKPGKEASYKFAERLGIEKCKEIVFPEGIKDANDYFKEYIKKDFLKLVDEARPFYTRKYNDLLDVISILRDDQQEKLEIDIIPDVKLTPDHLLSMAGSTNAGKTMYALNITKRLVEKGIPTLVLPYERGVQVVGSRFLQILLEKTEDELKHAGHDDWDKMIRKVVNTPAYFALPGKDEFADVIIKAKRILGIKAVVVDHLDYMIRGQGNEESAIRGTMHELKALAIEHQIMMFVVTHTRRTQQPGSKGGKPTMHDMRGSESIAQDSETVVMLNKESDTEMQIDIQKNKGKMSNKIFNVDYETGLMGKVSEKATSLDDF